MVPALDDPDIRPACPDSPSRYMIGNPGSRMRRVFTYGSPLSGLLASGWCRRAHHLYIVHCMIAYCQVNSGLVGCHGKEIWGFPWKTVCRWQLAMVACSSVGLS